MNFFARYKKIFWLLGFLALIVLLGYIIWTLFFRTLSTSPAATSTPGTITGLPTIGPNGEIIGEMTGPGAFPNSSGTPGTISQNNELKDVATGGLTRTEALVKAPTLNPTLASDGQVQYYNQNDGLFYKINNQGEAVALSDKVFYNVDSVTWAPDKNRAILEYPDGSKILYNFETKKQVTLPAHWQDFSFSPSSNQIVSESIGLDPENRWLMISNDDGSQATAIENIGLNSDKVYPAWSPTNQIVALYTQGVDFDRQEVFFVGQNGENFKSTIVEGRGLETQWSTTGDRLLYSVYNSGDNLNPRLWIVDASGDTISQNRRSLDLMTWANKCTFSSNTEVYCAVPDSLERGAGLFPELADKTKDSLYKIDLTTGTQKLIAVPDGAYNISQVIVPANEDFLYFTDKTTQQLYKIRLR